LRTRIAIAVLTALVVLIALFVISADSPVILGPEEHWYTKTPGREVVLFVLMLLVGIAYPQWSQS
jgi:hypothetical protein